MRRVSCLAMGGSALTRQDPTPYNLYQPQPQSIHISSRTKWKQEHHLINNHSSNGPFRLRARYTGRRARQRTQHAQCPPKYDLHQG
jgi:hypothetical protein